MQNRVFETWKILNDIVDSGWKKEDVPKKLKGSLGVKLARNCISQHLAVIDPDLEVSAPNCFIEGSKYEYDLLIVHKDRKAVACFENEDELVAGASDEIVYAAADVVSVIEVKWTGLYDFEGQTDKITAAMLAAKNIAHWIRLGYISFTESIPVNEFYGGMPTKNLRDLTVDLLNKKLRGDIDFYFVSTHRGKQYDVSDFSEFERFCDRLIGK